MNTYTKFVEIEKAALTEIRAYIKRVGCTAAAIETGVAKRSLEYISGGKMPISDTIKKILRKLK